MIPDDSKDVERRFGSGVGGDDMQSDLVKIGCSITLRRASGGTSFEVVVIMYN